MAHKSSATQHDSVDSHQFKEFLDCWTFALYALSSSSCKITRPKAKIIYFAYASKRRVLLRSE
jgi:hypothetical protein